METDFGKEMMEPMPDAITDLSRLRETEPARRAFRSAAE